MPNIIEAADAAANTGTAYTLLAGQTAQGTLTGTNDHDWYKVNLVAGQSYSFAMTGSGTLNVQDTFLRLYGSDGTTVVASNDDGLPGRNSLFTFTATTTGAYYVDAAAFSTTDTGQYGLSFTAGSRPSFDLQMTAGVIDTDLSWSAPGAAAVVTYGFRQSPATYTAGTSNISTFTPLTETEKAAVRIALQFWSAVSGITFVEVNPGGLTDAATMLFGNYTSTTDGAGAFAYYPGSTVSTDSAGDVWLNTSSISTATSIPFGSYAQFAIMHEIGHALGLSHPGLYNAAPGVSITYAADAQFTQDSQQYSVMSYFDESNTGAQFNGYADTPMIADILAMQNVYGANTTTRTGDTIYGFNTNAGSVFDFSTNLHPAFAIWDAGGTDTIDASGFSQSQTINLAAGSFSSIGGLVNNISIALGATIENAIGGSGADIITGNAADNVLTGGLGNDMLDGGAGSDTADYSAALGTVAIDLRASVQTQTGGLGTDTLVSIENANGGAFDDTLNAVDPVIPLGSGPVTGSTLHGGGGKDTLIGGSADDTLFGDAGDDILLGYGGNDTISGGIGNDILAGGDGNDVLDGGAGNDYLYGGSGDDRLYGGSGDDIIYAQDGNDFISGGAGNDYINGGAGIDTVDYSDATSGIRIDLRGETQTQTGGMGIDNIENVENVNGGAFDDTLIAVDPIIPLGSGPVTGSVLHGNDGSDTLIGGSADDTLFGDAGDDILLGYGGNDTISGGIGNDILSGGDGNDILSGGTGNDYLYGDNGNDVMTGDAGNDSLYGGNGNDTLTGGQGTDYLIGGLGDDTFVFAHADFQAGVTDNIMDFHELAGSDFDHLQLQGSAVNYSFANVGVDLQVTDIATGGMISIRNFTVARMADQVTYY